VATRRYRSALRVFAEIMDADRAAALDAELRWFAEVLGTARDRQVLREHLDAALAELPPELVLGPVAARIHTLVTTDLAAAEAKATEAMASARYFALLRELRAWHEQPPLRGDVPAAEAERFVCRSKRAVRRRLGHAAEAADRDAAMHRVRKAAKRLRYAAELVEPELGGTARRQRKQAKRLQSELGQIQDHVVAAQFLLRAGRIAGTTPGENGFTFGLLYQRERAAADARIRCHLET
jgi:CHAD domain-containing protein